MGSKAPYFLGSICAALGCSIFVACMLLPSWLAGCADIGRIQDRSSERPSPNFKSSRSQNTSDFISGNLSNSKTNLLCVKQGLFVLHFNIEENETSLRLIVSDEPTLSIVASICMIIAIICSAFSIFALITAVAANAEVYEEKEKARSHALVGMILLLIAGALALGGMTSFTMGFQSLPFERFDEQLNSVIGNLLLQNQFPERHDALGSWERETVALILSRLSSIMNYSYAWYLGWVAAFFLCLGAIFSIVARRRLIAKPYSELNVMNM